MYINKVSVGKLKEEITISTQFIYYNICILRIFVTKCHKLLMKYFTYTYENLLFYSNTSHLSFISNTSCVSHCFINVMKQIFCKIKIQKWKTSHVHKQVWNMGFYQLIVLWAFLFCGCFPGRRLSSSVLSIMDSGVNVPQGWKKATVFQERFKREKQHHLLLSAQ